MAPPTSAIPDFYYFCFAAYEPFLTVAGFVGAWLYVGPLIFRFRNRHLIPQRYQRSASRNQHAPVMLSDDKLTSPFPRHTMHKHHGQRTIVPQRLSRQPLSSQ